MRGDRLLGVLSQVVPQVPAVGDLDRGRGAVPGALGVGPGPVPADHLRAGMRLQPRLEGSGLPVRQQVGHVPGPHVDQHRPVHLALGQREVIDPEHQRRSRDLRFGRRGDQPQHRRGVHGDAEGPGQPGGGPPGQLQPEPGQHAQQRDAAPPVPLAHPRGLLGERDRRAPRVLAAEPAHLQDDQHRPATRRAVRHHPRIPAMHPRRLQAAPRAARRPRPARRRDHHRMHDVFHAMHAQTRQVREQRGQQAFALLRNVPGNARGAGRPRRRHDRLRRQRGSRVRGSWQTRVLPEPRCLITQARRSYPRSSHSPAPAASGTALPGISLSVTRHRIRGRAHFHGGSGFRGGSGQPRLPGSSVTAGSSAVTGADAPPGVTRVKQGECCGVRDTPGAAAGGRPPPARSRRRLRPSR